MSDAELIERFVRLFDGNRRVLGLDGGGCERLDTTDEWRVAIQAHLAGKMAIGVYPMMIMHDSENSFHGNVVKWGCVDIDTDDLNLARNFRLVLEQLGVAAWIERSRSKGYHVWVFAEDWVPAKDMRRALLFVADKLDFHGEVNPKQESLEGGQVGNYVRLPYPGGLHDGIMDRRVVIDPALNVPGFTLEAFLDLTEAHLTPPALLAEIADRYVPPPPVTMDEYVPTTAVPDVPTRGLLPKLLAEGPLEGMDRSSYLFKVAVKAWEAGYDGQGVFDFVWNADHRFGRKFVDRKDGRQRVSELVSRARAQT